MKKAPKRKQLVDPEAERKRLEAKARHARSKQAGYNAYRRLRAEHPEEWQKYYLEEAEKLGFTPRKIGKKE